MISLWRLVCCLALAGAGVAQTPKQKALLLPSEIHLSGIVTTSDGKPIPGARIDHSGTAATTDSEGKFDLHTRAPAVVFRADGYQSKHFRLDADAALTVALTGPAPEFRRCGACTECTTLGSLASALCLPAVKGVRAGPPDYDIDYDKQLLSIKSRGGKLVAIQHSVGSMWSFGLPPDEDVWAAREYHEADYHDEQGRPIVDARGKNFDGNCWRILGKFGETASYRNVAAEDIPLLDQVLDGASLRIASK